MMNNFQMYRHIMSPGWTLGWGWAKKEVIWSMVGAQTTDKEIAQSSKVTPHIAVREFQQWLICYLECPINNRLQIAAKQA